MSWGILAAQDALTADPDAARAKVRALNVAVIVACPAHADLFNHVNAPARSPCAAWTRARWSMAGTLVGSGRAPAPLPVR